MKRRNLSTKKNVRSICPVCPSSRSFHPALEAYLRSFSRKEPLNLALPHPSPDSKSAGDVKVYKGAGKTDSKMPLLFQLSAAKACPAT